MSNEEKETITARLDRNFAFELDLIKRVEAKVAEETAEKVWREAMEFLMNNAGNYCNCKNAYGDQCDKHAMTYCQGLLDAEGKRRGYLK